VELNLSTFLLEILNFLVLVWILKRFLYQPVLDVIARRRESIDKTMSEARDIERDARALQERYNGRLAEWEAERAKSREALDRELDEERSMRLAELRSSLDEERRKMHAAESQRMADLRARDEQRALTLAARFATRLLELSATVELETKLVEQVIADLEAMSAERLTALLGNPDRPPQSISVTSAYPLSQEHMDKLGGCLGKLLELENPLRFERDADLLAGIRVTIGDCVLGLNLQDELEGFARLGDGID